MVPNDNTSLLLAEIGQPELQEIRRSFLFIWKKEIATGKSPWAAANRFSANVVATAHDLIAWGLAFKVLSSVAGGGGDGLGNLAGISGQQAWLMAVPAMSSKESKGGEKSRKR